MIDRISLPCSSSQSLMKQQHLPYLYPTCITSMLKFFTPLTIINISKTMWNYYSHRQNVYVNINDYDSHRQNVYVNINYSHRQNVYVNIGRILAAAGKLIEGGHYAAGHVRFENWDQILLWLSVAMILTVCRTVAGRLDNTWKAFASGLNPSHLNQSWLCMQSLNQCAIRKSDIVD